MKPPFNEQPDSEQPCDNDDTQRYTHIELVQSPEEGVESSVMSDSDEPVMFEVYEPRSVDSIVAQQRAIQESYAAEAAAIILEGVDQPDFVFEPNSDTLEVEEDTQLNPGRGHKPMHRIRVQRVSPMGRLVSPGAQFIYALLIITLLGGLIGLAATIESPQLVLVAGIASPILLPICAWKWIRWLDSTPYYCRLLTSLGEDARNLMNYRLLWKHASTK